MSTVLVVDDSEVERQVAARLLQQLGSVTVVFAGDGNEALERVCEGVPDLVLTDLQMPGLSGLDLVVALRASHASVPVVLMTAYGSEETAADALRRGAASYVPKANLARDLAPTVARTLELWRARDAEVNVNALLVETWHRFELENDPALVSPLVATLAEQARLRGICDGAQSMFLSIALDEAISNALHHGNLEVDSRLREEGMVRYLAELTQRRHREPYSHRRVHVDARIKAGVATYVVRDDGPGFDRARVPDPLDPENLTRASGRGLVLIQTFMDEVTFNEPGNEITMVKRRK